MSYRGCCPYHAANHLALVALLMTSSGLAFRAPSAWVDLLWSGYDGENFNGFGMIPSALGVSLQNSSVVKLSYLTGFSNYRVCVLTGSEFWFFGRKMCDSFLSGS